ncbi:MAG: zeta toxin family protein [Lachnospiraceae bacterium]|nr:zeta toxin family protein [Lachnospiraceae bacterium]
METKKPMLLVFAGPNGSGKSTITDYLGTVGEYTNADDIVKAMGIDNKQAAEIVEKKRYEAIESKLDFTFETVLSSEYPMRVIRKAKEEGYFIKCIFVLTIDPEVNILRVDARVSGGGHDVPKDKIRDRYYKSLGNVKELIDLCDILHIYDNTREEAVRILRKHKEEDITIFPNDLWDEERIINLVC